MKWVGGKRQLLPELLNRVDAASEFKRYHEPFLGGGALFFELSRLGRLERQAYLSDNNGPLIATYEGVKLHVDEVIAALDEHKALHSERHYYEVRFEMPDDPVEVAARIIYLNKTGYNGLYRENSKGFFNVPFGRYKNPAICDEDNLRAASRALKNAKIENRHFETVRLQAKPGDLVYFDPPYHPISKTSSFTAYDRGGFGEDSQRLLATVCRELTESGVKILLSNSMSDLIVRLYSDDFTIDEVLASRNVNSKGDRRGKVSEALVRNF
ncbi:MAG: DNA adenine methylase [Candidatus Hydrogenedentota bacterium]